MARIFTISRSGIKRLAIENKDGLFVDLLDVLSANGTRSDLLPRNIHELLLNYEHYREIMVRMAAESASNAESKSLFRREEIKIEAPIERPPKIMGIAFNNATSDRFRQRFERIGNPGWFLKSPTCVIGNDDEVQLPPSGWSNVTTPEVELGVVIQKKSRWIQSREEALDAIAGYTIVNDVSAQDLVAGSGSSITAERFFSRKIIPDPADPIEKDQLAGPNRIEMKQWDTFAPMGPCIVTRDEITDPQDQSFSAKINGRTVMSGAKIELIWDIPTILRMFSKIMTLEPGDVVISGNLGRLTPECVLKPGDLIELTIEKIGTLRNRCIGSNFPPIW